MERATYAVPRLRQRVQPAPANLTAPMWVDDPNFDLRYHVRHMALPKPGTMRQLLDLASLIACDPFDRTRPLWQFVVVDGLRGGKSALIQKLHHTIVDGEGGVQLSCSSSTSSATRPSRPRSTPSSIAAAAEPAAADTPSPDLLRDLLTGSLRMPIGLLKQVKDLLADPTGIPDAGSAAADTVRGVMQPARRHRAARAHRCGPQRSLQRRMEVLRAPFGETTAAAKRLGGTLNTAFLDRRRRGRRPLPPRDGQPVEQLRASMAISTRTESVGRQRVLAGAHAGAHRRHAHRRALRRHPGSHRRGHARRRPAARWRRWPRWPRRCPLSSITRLARQQAQTVDFATSNVRGAPMPMYLAGAQAARELPGRSAGRRGVQPHAAVSYNHSLDMGVNIDTGAVAEPELLRALPGASVQGPAARPA